MKKARHHEMLRSDIREFVIRSGCKMLEDMISQAKEREIDLGHPRKRPKTSDQHLRGHQGQGQCSPCGELHSGVCPSRTLGCYKYGRVGHVSKDFP